MKLLLDENLPHQMRFELPGHEVATAAFMNWSGVENGELLQRAANTGFDAVITNDQGLEYEQNLQNLPIAVVVLITAKNNLESIRPLYADLLALLERLQPCQFHKLPAR